MASLQSAERGLSFRIIQLGARLNALPCRWTRIRDEGKHRSVCDNNAAELRLGYRFSDFTTGRLKRRRGGDKGLKGGEVIR